jgi:predicted transcriptional regulator
MNTGLTDSQRETLAENCYNARDRVGMSAGDVAHELEKSEGYVYQIEAGAFNVPLATLLRLRKIYGLKSLAPLLKGL